MSLIMLLILCITTYMQILVLKVIRHLGGSASCDFHRLGSLVVSIHWVALLFTGWLSLRLWDVNVNLFM